MNVQLKAMEVVIIIVLILMEAITAVAFLASCWMKMKKDAMVSEIADELSHSLHNNNK